MSAKKGSLVIVKVGNGGSPSETFATVGGMQLVKIMLENRRVSADSMESGVWRTLMTGVGIRSLSVTVEGVFTNAASEEAVRGLAFAGAMRNFKLELAHGGVITGAFLVRRYDRSGAQDGAEMYAMTLESAGAVSYA